MKMTKPQDRNLTKKKNCSFLETKKNKKTTEN